MVKKLFIALVALSFLVGNLAFAEKTAGPLKESIGQSSSPSAAAYMPYPGFDCAPQDWTCHDLSVTWDYGFANTSGAPLADDWWMVAQEFDPVGLYTNCFVDQIGFVLVDYGYQSGPVRVTVRGQNDVIGYKPSMLPADLLWEITIDFADIDFYPNVHYLNASTTGWPTGGIAFDDYEYVYVVLEAVDPADFVIIACEPGLECSGGDCTSDEAFRGLQYSYDGVSMTWGWSYYLQGYCAAEPFPYDFINHHIYADICCDEVQGVDVGNLDWPTHQQNYGRTGYIANKIGPDVTTNLRRLWAFESDWSSFYSHPVITMERVYIAFYDEVVCLNLYNGQPVWRTGSGLTGNPFHLHYAAFLGNSNNDLRVTLTVVEDEGDGKVYFGTGSSSLNEGFVCANASNGDTIWVRHDDIGSGLPSAYAGITGKTRYSTSVIVDDVVFFGNTFGQLYALNANTGADVWNMLMDDGNSGIYYSPSTDGTNLFVGTSDGDLYAAPSNGGNLYKITNPETATPTVDSILLDDVLKEGMVAAPVYLAEEDALYIHCVTTSASSIDPDGSLMAYAAADLSPLWGAPQDIYMNAFITPSVAPYPMSNITTGGLHGDGWIYNSGPRTNIRQYSLGGNLNWLAYDITGYYGGFDDDFYSRSYVSYASTADPYVLLGTYWPEGTWRIIKAETADQLVQYNFPYGLGGTAVAEYDDHDYMVHTTASSHYFPNGNGVIHCYDIGPDRSRLYVPEHTITLPSVSFVDTYPAVRSADLFENQGVLPLNYSLTIQTAKGLPKHGSSWINKVGAYADLNLDQELEHGMNKADKGTSFDVVSRAAEFVRFPGGLTTLTGTLAGLSTLTQDFELDPDLMLRGAQAFYVDVDADDKDYLESEWELQGPKAYPHADPLKTIRMYAVLGYAFCEGYIDFGASLEHSAYHNNDGWAADGNNGDGFVIGYSAFLYHHTYMYGYENGHMAMLEEAGYGYNHFLPNSLCDETTFNETMYLSDGTPVALTGDVFAASFIDSLIDVSTGEYDPANTPGCEMFIRAYGGHHARFANFQYIYVEIENRGSDPLPDSLYWGTFTDWDVANYSANIGVGMIVDGASAYRVYDQGLPNFQYGMGSVPMAGNLFLNSDPTMGAYGTNQFKNSLIQSEILPYDSLFVWIDECPPYTDCYHAVGAPLTTGTDLANIIVADKQPLPGDGVIKGGLVMFGIDDVSSPTAEIKDLMFFANKFAGWGRGDCNDDNVINLLDLCVLNCYVNDCGCEIYPFTYLGDVDADGDVDGDDVTYLFNYLFMGGSLPTGDWIVR